MMSATDGREVSRLTKWIHPGPFSRMPKREVGRRRQVVEEEYIDHYSMSGSIDKEPSSTSTRTGSTSRSSGSTLRSGDRSQDSSFWLETFFSPTSSVSSSDDDSSTFKRPPRPVEVDASQATSSTGGVGEEEDLVYNDLENDEEEWEVKAAEELRRVHAEVRHQTRGAYAKAVHDWSHWWAKGKHDRRKLLAPHERRFVAEREEAQRQILHYHEEQKKRREEEEAAAARKPLERAISEQTLRNRSVANNARVDLLTLRADRQRASSELYIQMTHERHMATARPEHFRKVEAEARARRMPLHSTFESSVKLEERARDETPLVLQEICDTQALLQCARRAGVVRGVNPPERGVELGDEEMAGSQGLSAGTFLTLRLGDTTVRVHPRRAKTKGGRDKGAGGEKSSKGAEEEGGVAEKRGLTGSSSTRNLNANATERSSRNLNANATERSSRNLNANATERSSRNLNGNATESSSSRNLNASATESREKAERLAALERAFHVDLTRCRNVTVLRGDALLDRGVILLGQALGLGVCEQLVTLHLQSNGVGRLGMESLAKGFASGGAPGLETLSLQKNNLTGRSIEALMGAAKKGGLAKLKRLDLRYNQCGDVGACALASALLASGLPSLERALLQQNGIKDRGASALHMAVLVNPTRFCPSLQVLNIRQNSISVHCLRSMQPAAPALQY